jgi:hypothetical protein
LTVVAVRVQEVMSKHGSSLSRVGFAAAFVFLATAGISNAAPSGSPSTSHATPVLVELAQAGDSAPCAQSRYEPAGRASDSSFNDEYVFGLTRGIADSDAHPVAKILIFPLTVPLDLALLPFEAIGGLF